MMDEIFYYNMLCEKYNLKGFGFISGDSGIKYQEYAKIKYFRMGGYKSQLSILNKGFPVPLSDQLELIFNRRKIFIRQKKRKSTIGFCGQASDSSILYTYQYLKVLKENITRFINDPKRTDYESYFMSSFERFSILQNFRKSNKLITNFIFRKKYRAGAITKKDKRDTTIEYYNNLIDSDYIICIRGTGNFSVRLFETLMMGRIPIFFDTDCLLPLLKNIDWKNHVIWISWENQKNAAQIVKEFHENISDKEFKSFQQRNRKLWKDKLQPQWILNNLLGM